MEHCSRKDMAPIPSAHRHSGERSHAWSVVWFDGMKAGRSRSEPETGEQCCQVLARVHGHIFRKSRPHLRIFHRQNFHTYGLLSDILTSTLN
jgi:hypothetical protein